MIIRPFDPEKDVGLLYTFMFRSADIAELQAFEGQVIRPIIEAAVFNPAADTYIALTKQGRLIAIGGVAPLDDVTGIPWMVATDLFDRYHLALIKTIKAKLTNWFTSYPTLMGFIDTRNTLHMKFLAWLGFTYPQDQGFSKGGVYFQIFIQKGGKPHV